MKYGVVQSGFAFYGVGNSPDEAIEDAKEWVDDHSLLKDLVYTLPRHYGQWAIVKITDELYTAIKEIGGDVCHTVRDDNIYDVCDKYKDGGE